jgi:hypothetical protein
MARVRERERRVERNLEREREKKRERNLKRERERECRRGETKEERGKQKLPLVTDIPLTRKVTKWPLATES